MALLICFFFQRKKNKEETDKLLIDFKQSNGTCWQKLERGQLEVAGRWKDEVKACPAHKSGGKKGGEKQVRWEKGEKTRQVGKRRRKNSHVGKKERKNHMGKSQMVKR